MRIILLLILLTAALPAVEFTTATFPGGHKATGVYRKESNTLVVYRDGTVSSISLEGPDGTPVPIAPAAQEDVPYPALQPIVFTTVTMAGGKTYTGILDKSGTLAFYTKNGNGMVPLRAGFSSVGSGPGPIIMKQGPADPLDIPYQAYLEALTRHPPGRPGRQHPIPGHQVPGEVHPTPVEPNSTGAGTGF